MGGVASAGSATVLDEVISLRLLLLLLYFWQQPKSQTEKLMRTQILLRVVCCLISKRMHAHKSHKDASCAGSIVIGCRDRANIGS